MKRSKRSPLAFRAGIPPGLNNKKQKYVVFDHIPKKLKFISNLKNLRNILVFVNGLWLGLNTFHGSGMRH